MGMTTSATLRTVLVACAICSGTGLLLAACSGPATSSHSPSKSAAGLGMAGVPAVQAPAASGRTETATVTRLGSPGQSIIYTASLTIGVRAVPASARKATGMVTAVGGYVASEQEMRPPGARAVPQISLQLKIPVAAYPATLGRLGGLGSQIAFSQQATDVTQQVADVSSRVASAQAAIRQLRALLSRAGNVGALLAVQDEINTQESALEALLAQQRALAHETSYGTVSLTILARHAAVARRHAKTSSGFTAGLATGWRAFMLSLDWLATALGTALPFLAVLVLALGVVYGARRRSVRRGTPPAADPPAPAA